jgi:Tfp pilus assembly protein FimV
MSAELLARVRAEIDSRLAELRPAVDEYEQLLGAFDAFDAEVRAAPPTATAPLAKAPAAKARPAKAANVKAPKVKARPAKAPAAKATKAEVQPAKARAAKAPAAPLGAAEQAILAALEHGSHTVGELGVVTAISGPDIRTGLRRLQRAGTVVRTKREGRAAYALSSTA